MHATGGCYGLARWPSHREEMRRLGYRTVDMLVDQVADDSAPPLRRATPEEMARRLGGPPPAKGESIEQILAQLDRDVLPFMSRVAHPRFFAFVPLLGTWPGALGDLIASAATSTQGSWMESAGPSQVELELLGWFKDWIGYPAGASGSSGGRRLGGQHDRDRMCTRGAGRADGRRARRLRRRPSALLACASGAGARLSPGPGEGAAGRQHLSTHPGHRGRSDRCGPEAAGRTPLVVVGERRRHEHRRGRPVGRAGGALPRAGRVDARRRGLRGLRSAHRARTRRGSQGSSSPTR